MTNTNADREQTHPALRACHRAGVHLLALLILVQAMLAGRALFGTWSITVHGVMGNVTFMVALAVGALAFLGRVGRTAVLLASILAAVLTLQIGLGYLGRETAEAAAWHVPLGVLSFGLAVYQTAAGRQ